MNKEILKKLRTAYHRTRLTRDISVRLSPDEVEYLIKMIEK